MESMLLLLMYYHLPEVNVCMQASVSDAISRTIFFGRLRTSARSKISI